MVVQNVSSWLGKTVVFGKIEGLVVQQEDNFLTLITKSGQKVMVPNNSHVIDITAIQTFSDSIVDESVHKGAMTNDEVSDNKFENDSETEYPKTEDIAPNYKKVDDKQNKTKGMLHCPYCDKTFDSITERRNHMEQDHKDEYDKDVGKSYVELVREYSAKKGSDTTALYNNDTAYHAVEKNPVGDTVREVAVDMGNRAIGGGVLHKLPESQRNNLRTKPSDEVKPKKTQVPTVKDSGIDKTRTPYLGKQGTPIGFTNTRGLTYVLPKKKSED